MSNPYFVHEKAICESKHIGKRTRVWAFAHILPKATIGDDCNICDHVFIENDVVIGHRVTIKSGVQLWDGIQIEEDVFIGPNATFTNDKFPRSKIYPEKFQKTVLCRGSSIGANATLLPGIVIGEKAMVGAGAVVTKSVPPYAIVTGNPGKIVGYVDTHKVSKSGRDQDDSYADIGVYPTRIKGVQLYRLPFVEDLRGNLSVGEFEKTVPFRPKRYFMVFDVPNAKVRGEHAHRKCEQFIICVRGSVSVVADDGKTRQEFILNSPSLGIYIAPLVWGIQYKYSSDAILLVFASHYYDSADYIRDYSEFRKIAKK